MIKQTLISLSLVSSLSMVTLAEAADPVWQQSKSEQSYEITVYHSPTCGCCKGWVDHLKDHNFKVNDVLTDDVQSHKVRLGVPQGAASCHTAVVNGKVIEGHVPAQDIKALLAQQSNIQLLAVPGMPSGGPGMDFEGARKDAFKVYAQDTSGKVSVFNEYSDY
ncbi:MAG: DUF411 domain-containing protein [Motiliproteus sp.]|nr:DUF411 domain-containing protein [Motiliproteus sp.]MCW9050718.1 DUF411 domain-containing protein [Motiliproteus sp.]